MPFKIECRVVTHASSMNIYIVNTTERCNPNCDYNLQLDEYKQDGKILFMPAEIVCCVTTGIAAGLATGISRIAAAMIISPVLVTFLNVPAYEAVGIALAADIFSSTASAITYGKTVM